MSETITVNPSTDVPGDFGSTGSGHFRALVWKEFREIGFYGLVIMVLCAVGIGLTIFLEPAFDVLHEFIRATNGLVAVAKLLPVILILACTSASFSIEHENRSYWFLRSLPFPYTDIIKSKLLVLGALTVLSCLLFWPLGYYLSLGQKSWVTQKPDYLVNLVPASFGIAEAFLWSLYFSLVEKRVIQAMVKATLGYFLVTNGVIYFLTLWLGNSPELDGFFFWTMLCLRIVVATTLILLIRKSMTAWVREPKSRNFQVAKDRPAIQGDQGSVLPTTRRLIWLVMRTNRVLISLFVGFSLLVYLIGIYEGIGGNGLVIIWAITVSFLGVVSGQNGHLRNRLLVSAGYSPRRIWCTRTLLMLSLTVFFSILIWTVSKQYGPAGIQTIWYYLNAGLIAFGVGQFVSIFCRSVIPAFVSSAILTLFGYALQMFSLQAYHHQLPTVVILFALPLFWNVFTARKQMTIGKLDKRFWLIASITLTLTMIPLPFLRIYEVENADISSIQKFVPTLNQEELSKLEKVRMVADELLQFHNRMGSQFHVRIGEDSRSLHVDQVREIYADYASRLFEIDADQLLLLNNGEGDIKDLERWLLLRLVLAELSRRLQDQIEIRTVEYQSVNQYFKRIADWHMGYIAPGLMYWWVQHPQTKQSDVIDLIKRLEDESELIRHFRGAALVDHQYCLAALETAPEEFPRLLMRGGFWARIPSMLPWERERFKRNANTLLKNNWDYIDAMEAGFQKAPFVRPETMEYRRTGKDMIADQLEYSRIFHVLEIQQMMIYRRSARVYLALALWQKEHDGQLPVALADLEKEYEISVPVTPQDGLPFYLARNGLNSEQFEESKHVESLPEEWQKVAYTSSDRTQSVVGQPFFWMNDYQHPKLIPQPTKIKSVEELIKSDGESHLVFWVLPKTPMSFQKNRLR